MVQSDEAAASSRHPVARVVMVWGVVAALWLLVDQITKVLAVVALEDTGRIIDLGIIQLRTIRNPGGAFGLPGLPGLFVVVSAVVLFLVIRALPRTERLDVAAAYGLVTGGAIGNLMDRLFRVPGFPSGAVVDFLDLRWWPVFNVADAGIVIGAISIALLMTRDDRQKRAAENDAAARPPVQSDAANPPR